jgi:hypothetical protein
MSAAACKGFLRVSLSADTRIARFAPRRSPRRHRTRSPRRATFGAARPSSRGMKSRTYRHMLTPAAGAILLLEWSPDGGARRQEAAHRDALRSTFSKLVWRTSVPLTM